MNRINHFCLLLTLFLLSCSKENISNVQSMVYIPTGEFVMGSEDVDTEGFGKEFGVRKGRFYEDERPMRKISLKGFSIDTYEVTNKQYKKFVDVTGYKHPLTWVGGIYPDGTDNHPVADVTWFDAYAFCVWAGKRLPTEEEWEKAARGPNGNVYPWGNDYDEAKSNVNQETTAPVGSYKGDRSYYGVYDMGGNLMEWVDAWYEPYPGNTMQHKDFGGKYRVLRGGSSSAGHYILSKIFSRSSYRYYDDPFGAGEDGGFRCAADAR